DVARAAVPRLRGHVGRSSGLPDRGSSHSQQVADHSRTHPQCSQRRGC
ncbi:hypothetical protein BN1708_019625, partial [Verticillium longisporum]